MSKWLVPKHVLSLVLVVGLGGCSAKHPPQPLDSAQRIFDVACHYLWSTQSDDGGWHSETHGLLRSGQALTPFVLHALLKATPQLTKQRREQVELALDFIRNSVNRDGVVGLADPDVAEYPNYASAFAVRCLVAAGGPQDRDLIDSICRYLRSQQFSENRGFGREHPVHGAWGFGGPVPLGGSPGHVDISYTRHVLEALRDANAIDEEIATRAQLFLKRMQREGGFYFSPVVAAANKGETTEDGDGPIYLPYATATSEGLLALLASGLKADDPRVLGALKWLDSQPDLAHPGGIAHDHPDQWGKALFYYHLSIRGEVSLAHAKGDLHRESLTTLLSDRQQLDGSFVNPYGTLMKEDDPILATTLAIIALNAALCK